MADNTAADQAPRIAGLHHIGLVSRDISRSRDFYERILGLTYHGESAVPLAPMGDVTSVRSVRGAWFGDAAATPGSMLLLSEQPEAAQGAPGMGGSHHFALAVADRDVLLQWKRRFLDNGYAVNGILDRHYFQSIYIKDPDGQIVELATLGPGWSIDEPAGRIGQVHCFPPEEMINTNRDRARIAAENWPDAVPEISSAMTIRGLHHVTAIGENIRRLHEFVHGGFGMQLVKQTNNFDDAQSFHWYWGVDGGAPGTLVTYFERNPGREAPVRMGAGQIAHYGLATSTTGVEMLRERVLERGGVASPLTSGDAPHRPFTAFATQDPDGHPVMIASL